METRGNYILIGIFTLAGIIGIVGLFLWFARVELDQQFDYYDIQFSSVSGLSQASDVRFSGLPVGQVVDVRLSPSRDGTIRVRVEVDAATPVRTDSIATIESQGVTGVSFVQISPGTPEAALYDVAADDPIPVLEAGRSVIQSLSEDAPQLIEQTLEIVQDLNNLFGDENQTRIDNIITNVEEASDIFASTLEDFSGVAGSVTDFSVQIGEFTAILNGLSDDLEAVLQTTDSTLARIGGLTDDAEALLQTGTETLGAARRTLEGADTFITGELTQTTSALRESLDSATATFDTSLSDATRTLSDGLDRAVSRLDTTLTETADAVQTTLSGADAFIAEDLARTTADLRAAVAALQADVDAISTDARGLMQTFNTTGETATARLTEAEATLAAVDAVIEEVSAAFETVDEAAESFDALLEESGAPLLAETRAAVADAAQAIESVASTVETDLPAIVADIRTGIETATAAVQTVAADLSGASGSIEDVTGSANQALLQVTETFANANTTLDAINSALATGESALVAAESAFIGADRVINEDIDGIITGLENSLTALNEAIATVSDDLPEISAELTSASRSAGEAFRTLDGVIRQAGPSVTTFTQDGLPLVTRLADETRGLIRNIDRLTQQIQRDPARFLLNRDSPEFRR
ncbi:MCE family protein [Cognatishimia sp. F0-27]|nr:MCE family protein [Cognatishimia sp. F0-27]